MKYVITVLAVLVSFAVTADPRITHQWNSNCHFPKDAVNTDYEDKIACPKSRLIGDENGKVVAGYAIVKEKVPCDFLPPRIDVASDGTNGDCLLENDDKAEYNIPQWTVKIRGNAVRKANGKLVCTAIHELICGTGDDGYIVEE